MHPALFTRPTCASALTENQAKGLSDVGEIRSGVQNHIIILQVVAFDGDHRGAGVADQLEHELGVRSH